MKDAEKRLMGAEARTERNLSREERIREKAYHTYLMFQRNGFREDALRDWYIGMAQVEHEGYMGSEV